MEPLPTKTLGQLLRELRQRANLSLRDLGEKLKDPATNTPVSAAFLSDIENGRRFPSEDMIDKIAEALNCDAMELRKSDPRGPVREIQDLSTMNAKYAFAFRRAVDFVLGKKLSPEEFIRRVEADQSVDAILGRLKSALIANNASPEDTKRLMQILDSAAPPSQPHSSPNEAIGGGFTEILPQ